MLMTPGATASAGVLRYWWYRRHMPFKKGGRTSVVHRFPSEYWMLWMLGFTIGLHILWQFSNTMSHPVECGWVCDYFTKRVGHKGCCVTSEARSREPSSFCLVFWNSHPWNPEPLCGKSDNLWCCNGEVTFRYPEPPFYTFEINLAKPFVTSPCIQVLLAGHLNLVEWVWTILDLPNPDFWPTESERIIKWCSVPLNFEGVVV